MAVAPTELKLDKWMMVRRASLASKKLGIDVRSGNYTGRDTFGAVILDNLDDLGIKNIPVNALNDFFAKPEIGINPVKTPDFSLVQFIYALDMVTPNANGNEFRFPDHKDYAKYLFSDKTRLALDNEQREKMSERLGTSLFLESTAIARKVMASADYGRKDTPLIHEWFKFIREDQRLSSLPPEQLTQVLTREMHWGDVGSYLNLAGVTDRLVPFRISDLSLVAETVQPQSPNGEEKTRSRVRAIPITDMDGRILSFYIPGLESSQFKGNSSDNVRSVQSPENPSPTQEGEGGNKYTLSKFDSFILLRIITKKSDTPSLLGQMGRMGLVINEPFKTFLNEEVRAFKEKHPGVTDSLQATPTLMTAVGGIGKERNKVLDANADNGLIWQILSELSGIDSLDKAKQFLSLEEPINPRANGRGRK